MWNMERYRSGHNGAVLKTVRRQRHRGSNPLLSATSEQSPLRSKTDSSFELSVFSLRPQNWLTKQRRRGLHIAAAIFCAFIWQPSFPVLYCSMRQKMSGGNEHGRCVERLDPSYFHSGCILCVLPPLLFRAQTDGDGSLPPAGHGAVCPLSGSDDADGPDCARAPR